jgi:hypothetical protein
VTPVAAALSTVCGGQGIATSAVTVCGTEQFGPAAGTVVVVAVGSVAVAEPTSFGGGPTDCLVVTTGGSSAIALAPPGPPC